MLPACRPATVAVSRILLSEWPDDLPRVEACGLHSFVGRGFKFSMPHHPVKSEPSVQGETERTVGPTLLKDSRRLVEQSHDLLQAARLLLERCEAHYPTMPARLKRVA
jgi:hypothetical protein